MSEWGPFIQRSARCWSGVGNGATALVALALIAGYLSGPVSETLPVDGAPVAFVREPLTTPDQSVAAAFDRQRARPPRRHGGQPAIRVLNPGTAELTAGSLAPGTVDDAAAAGNLTPDDDTDPSGTLEDWFPPDRSTFRTVCVRLCDGAMTPVSFATKRDRFAVDALRCRNSCGSASKLYVQANPATEAEGLVDLVGRKYIALETAFRFRTTYDSACTCRPHAWQAAAQARHRLLGRLAHLHSIRSGVYGRVAELKAAAGDAAKQLEQAAAARENGERAARQAARKAARNAPRPRIRDAAEAAAPDRTADAGRRRFDGSDWRITLYEPL